MAGREEERLVGAHLVVVAHQVWQPLVVELDDTARLGVLEEEPVAVAVVPIVIEPVSYPEEDYWILCVPRVRW